MERARAVCCFIKTKLPHAVFLQEVVDPTWTEITKELSTLYDCFSSRSSAHYYVASLVRKDAVSVTGRMECLKFDSSTMGRCLLQLQVRFAGRDILLLNSHLESMDDPPRVREREKQLKTAFEVMLAAGKKRPELSCVFAGDLNVMDEEVERVSR